MKLLKKLIITYALILSPIAFALTYVIQKGDTLSEIAQKNFSGPIYGKNGSLQKILILNPTIKDKNKIKYGKIIDLGPFDLQRNIANTSTEEKIELKPITEPTSKVESPHSNEAKDRNDNAPIEKLFSNLKIVPMVFFARIDSTDINTQAKAIIISNMSYGIKLNWEQNWSEDTSTFQEISSSQITFLENQSSSITIENKAVVANQLGLGANFRKSKEISWGAKLNYAQEVFPRGQSTASSIVLDSVSLPEAALYAKFKLAQRFPFQLTADLEAKSLLGGETTNYSINPGTGYLGRIGFEQDKEKYKFGCGVYYSQQQQDTSVMKSNRKDVGLEINFSW